MSANLEQLVGAFEQSAYNGERIVIKKQQEPLVAIVPIEDLQLLESMER